MKSVTRLTIVQMKLFLREPAAFFFTLVFPALLLVLYGAIWGNEPAFGTPFGYIDFQLPALAGIVIGTVAFMSIPVATATAREQKILRRYKATPLHPLAYIAAEVAVYFLLSLGSMILLVIVGRLLFGLRFDGNILLVLVGFALSALAFIATGYLVASLAPTSRVAQVVGNVVYFPMLFLSGATLPQDIMPEGIRRLSEWLPMTHLVRLMQDLWLGEGWSWSAAAILAGMLVIGTVVAARTFRWE